MTSPPKPRFSFWKLLRSLAGLILAPVAGGAVVFGGLEFIDGFQFGRMSQVPSALILGGYLGLIVGAPGAIILGWPLHLLMLRQRWTSVWAYLGFGALLGVAAFFVSAFVLGSSFDLGFWGAD